MEKHPKDFCVFILTHGRPDKVITWATLRKCGYGGPLYLVIDNEDKCADQYYEKFGRENVIMFDKEEIASRFDNDSTDRRKIVYARNACFDIAERLGYKWFLELDDDYTQFKYRMNDKFEHPKSCPDIHKTLGDAIYATLEFYKSIPASSIAFSQGGDWFGGRENFGKLPKRKCMNSFFLSTERRFWFIDGTNEDVNTYTSLGSVGNLFLTLPPVQLTQKQTQSGVGGMSSVYLSQGTYVKSFGTVICSPSSVTIGLMGSAHKRIHHKINWGAAVPMVISEMWKKYE